MFETPQKMSEPRDMRPVVVEYPEELPGLLKLTEEQFAAEVRFLAAAKLFELGKLSSGKVAAMAGLGRVAFLHKLGEYGFCAINLHMNRSMPSSGPPPSLLHEHMGSEYVASRVSRQSGPAGAVASRRA
jgi:hypothetical protein